MLNVCVCELTGSWGKQVWKLNLLIAKLIYTQLHISTFYVAYVTS